MSRLWLTTLLLVLGWHLRLYGRVDEDRRADADECGADERMSVT
jgi:hypothetical protein